MKSDLKLTEDNLFDEHDAQVRQLRMEYLRASATVKVEDFDDLEDFDDTEFSNNASFYPVDLDEPKVPDFDKVFTLLAENPNTALCLADYVGLDPLEGVTDKKKLRKIAARDLLSPYADVRNKTLSSDKVIDTVFVRDCFKFSTPQEKAPLVVMVDTKNRLWVELNSSLKAFGVNVSDYVDRMPEFYHKHMITKAFVKGDKLSRRLVPWESVFMTDIVFNHFALEFLEEADLRWVMFDLTPKMRAHAYAAILYKGAPVQELFEMAETMMQRELEYKNVMIETAKETIARQNTRLQRLQDYYALMTDEFKKMREELEEHYEKKAKRRVIRYEPTVVYDKDGNPVLHPKQFIPENLSEVKGEVGVYEGPDLGHIMTDGKFIDAVASHLQDFESPYYDDQVVLIDYLLEDLSVVHMGLTHTSLSNMLKVLGFVRHSRTSISTAQYADSSESYKRKLRTVYCIKGFKKPVDYVRQRIASFGIVQEFPNVFHNRYMEGSIQEGMTDKVIEDKLKGEAFKKSIRKSHTVGPQRRTEAKELMNDDMI